jgi:urate oxidase
MPGDGPTAREHVFTEVCIDVDLHGDFDAAYTKADNRLVIATDTCKNAIYVLAKEHEIDAIESFGLTAAHHFVDRYEQVSQCSITLRERVWNRLLDSPHCFTARDRAAPTASVTLTRDQPPVVAAGVQDLLVAKTTESGFSDFHQNELRTLKNAEDRVLATELSASWRYDSADVDFAACRTSVVDSMLAKFTDHFSHSVQETLYLMGGAALRACPLVSQITLAMPNKHHLLADLAPFGLTNKNEVFVVTEEPFGYVTGTIVRD